VFDIALFNCIFYDLIRVVKSRLRSG